MALIEFALVLPLLLLLILAMLDVGKAVNYWNDETHLANEAARYVAVNNCSACGGMKVNQWIKNEAATTELRSGGGSIGGTGMTVDICFPDGSTHNKVGDPVKVTMTAQYNWMHFLLGALGPSANLKGSATMRLEANYNGTAYTATGC